MNNDKVRDIFSLAEERIMKKHIGKFPGMEKPIFMISEQYPGVWLEHLYDSVMLAKLYPEKSEYMKNIISLFIEHQSPEGQLPCYIFNKEKVPEGTDLVGYGQVQECLSFASVCLMAYEITGDGDLLSKCYTAASRWVEWLRVNRMTRALGLPEMFTGFDTGHDRSGRLIGISCPGNFTIGGVLQNAATLPPYDGITPIIAPDMASNYYGNLSSLAKMAKILGDNDAASNYEKAAADVKSRIFDICFDPDDVFFYDVDRNGDKRKIRSSSVLHLFLEGVLDRDTDADLIERIYSKHIKNPDEFWTPYPLPSTAYNDPTARDHESFNSWGYFCQLLIYLRCTVWMDEYGFSDDFDFICRRVLEALTDCFDSFKLGQELDPVTGKPSPSSEWYSSCMLFYIYAARRLRFI